MPAARLTRAQMQEAVNLLHKHGTITVAAQAANMPRNTLQSRLREAFASGITSASIVVEPTLDAKDQIIANLRSELESKNEQIAKVTRPHFTIRQDASSRSSKIRVVCIGDAHDSPAIPDKSRFEWIGKYINESKPDIVVQIGDFATLDSLNTHVPNETFAGKAKPTFINDMVSFNEALDAMQINGVERHCTLGNHERRLYHYEDRAPEAYGMMQFELQRIFEKHKWTFSPYGMPYVLGGVSFVHCCINTLGKSYGGKNAENTIANDAIGDWVIGHSHRKRVHRAPKLGGNNFVTIFNLGCSLPDGHIEEYAAHTLNGWSYDIAEMTIQHGHIADHQFVSLASLEERYARKAS